VLLPAVRRPPPKNGLLVGSLFLLLALTLVGCLGPWPVREVTPTLYLGEPVVGGGQGHLLISVADMPGGGIAAILVDREGLLYDAEKVSGIAIEGLNGFAVAVSQFANGEGGFILVNISFALESGPALKLTFDAHGIAKHGDIRLLADHITLVSNTLALIENWKTPAYYAR
jgi:hypothetical protein